MKDENTIDNKSSQRSPSSDNRKDRQMFKSPHPRSPYYIENGWLMKLPDDLKGNPQIIGRRVEIDSIQNNIDTMEVFFKLSFDYRNESRTIAVPRETLFSRSKLPALLRYGVDILDHKVQDVHKHLNHQEQSAPISNVHCHVGFGEFEGQLIYKHWRAIGCDSSYQGDLNIEPKGSFKVWKALVKEEVMGNTPLELALLLGLSAPVATLIGRRSGLEVIIFHIFGDSTQGKTTATRLAVSPFGCPDTKKGGLIKTWDNTPNAMFAQLRGIHGLPIAFDEASMHDGHFSTFIYKLAGGQEKKRLNKEAELKESGQWDGVILSNAEHSLLTKSSQNVGIRMRLFEFGDITWTTSAENADALKQGLLQNYGHAGPRFVKYLMKQDIEEILCKWDSYRQLIYKKVKNPDRFTNRIADKLAVILVTAIFAEKALSLVFNQKGILKMLLKQIQENSEERDLGQKVHEYFMQTVVQHSAKFSSESREQWGLIVKKDNEYDQVLVLPHQFEKILNEGGFGNSLQVILKNWASRGWLDCDKNKLTRKRTLCPGLPNTRVHVVLVPKE